MAYADFTLESVEDAFGLSSRVTDLFPGLVGLPVPDWLSDYLQRSRRAMPLFGSRAKSIFIVAPILLACSEFGDSPLTIFSGRVLDVEPSLGLCGECDFLLDSGPNRIILRTPRVVILQARESDIDLSLGQGIAQMVASRIFNERAGEPSRPIFGCVTTGDDWQFLRLDGSSVIIDQTMRYLSDVGGILAALRECLVAGRPVPAVNVELMRST